MRRGHLATGRLRVFQKPSGPGPGALFAGHVGAGSSHRSTGCGHSPAPRSSSHCVLRLLRAPESLPPGSTCRPGSICQPGSVCQPGSGSRPGSGSQHRIRGPARVGHARLGLLERPARRPTNSSREQRPRGRGATWTGRSDGAGRRSLPPVVAGGIPPSTRARPAIDQGAAPPAPGERAPPLSTPAPRLRGGDRNGPAGSLRPPPR